MRNVAMLGLVVVGTFACAAEAPPSEPSVDTPAPQNGELVLGEYVGEVDVLRGEMKIRPALPHEQAPGLAAKSWSRISGSGTPAPTINVATGALTKTAAGASAAISATGVANPIPTSASCGGANAQQCGYVWITQAATNAVPIRQPVAVIYDVTNGVKLANTEALPDSDPSSDYSLALPASTSTRFYVRYGNTSGTTPSPAWSTGSWPTTTAQSVGRNWNWDLGSTPAVGFTFKMQVWAVVDRTDYFNKFVADPATFFDACTASSGGTVTTYATSALQLSSSCPTKADCGYAAVTLPFPFSLYDFGKSGGTGAATSLKFWVDGSLTLDPTSDAALSGSNQATTLYATSGTPNYGIYPYRANLTLGTGSQLCSQVNGTKPSRIVSFTWKAVRTATANQPVNFTARLYENSDKIDFQYGAVNNTGHNSDSVAAGIRRDASAVLTTSYVCLVYNGGSGNCKDISSSSVGFSGNVSYSITPTLTGSATSAYKGP